jgi:hypothetical protein
MKLPDIEAVSAAVHDSWMDGKRKTGIKSRKAENGEELMVPYAKLSDPQKEQDRATVRTVYEAINRLSEGDSMFPPKKKPFPAKPDLSEPDSLDAKPTPKMPMHEEAEEPAVEASGAKLLADIEAAGEEHGLDAETSRKVAGSMFAAAAKCLAGEQGPVAEYDAGGMSMEGEEE